MIPLGKFTLKINTLRQTNSSPNENQWLEDEIS